MIDDTGRVPRLMHLYHKAIFPRPTGVLTVPSSFTLGAHFEGFIKSQVNSGRYASASEVVRDSLRLLEEQDAMRQARLDALRAEIEHGVASGSRHSCR